MKSSPTHDEVAQRAQQIWQKNGCPSGNDTAIWLEAERQLESGSSERNSPPASTETATAHHGLAPIPERAATTAAVQKKEARAPKLPTKTAPKPAPPESGKPLWNTPHSS